MGFSFFVFKEKNKLFCLLFNFMIVIGIFAQIAHYIVFVKKSMLVPKERTKKRFF